MTRNDFFKKLDGKIGRYDRKRIYWAYWMAKHVHRNQKRKTGERYFEHCRRVACLLIDFSFLAKNTVDAEEIILGLIHDCEEDGFMPKDLITCLFGSFVAEGMGCLTKVYIHTDEAGIVISKVRKSDDEHFTKLSGADIQIRRVKIADRFDNLRDMQNVWPIEKQKEYIDETVRGILPLIPSEDMDNQHSLGNRLLREVETWLEKNSPLR